MYTTHFNPSTPTLSQILYIVATTSTRIRLFSWNQPKIHVPLHQLFDSYVSSFLIMIFGFWLVMEKGSQLRTLFLFNTLTATAIQRIVLHHYRPQAE